MATMRSSERDAFLRDIRIGFLTTHNADGSANTLPLWYHWDGDKIRMFSSRDSGKVRRILKDPRGSLTVANGVGEPEAWVSVQGTIAVLDEGGLELACRLASCYYEPGLAGKTIEEWKKMPDWVLLELTPSTVRSY